MQHNISQGPAYGSILYSPLSTKNGCHEVVKSPLCVPSIVLCPTSNYYFFDSLSVIMFVIIFGKNSLLQLKDMGALNSPRKKNFMLPDFLA